jgi:hypothetical protein
LTICATFNKNELIISLDIECQYDVISSDLEDSLANYRYLHRSNTPLASDDITQRVRQQSQIARFNDMYTIDRIEAMATLAGYSDDHENNQRIVFAAMQVRS